MTKVKLDGTYADALKKLFSPSDQRTIQENLARWRLTPGKAGHIVRNITQEQHLKDHEAWRGVLSVFLKYDIDLLTRFETVCQQFKLRGELIDMSNRPKRVGKVLSRRTFNDLMRDNHKLQENDVEVLLAKVLLKTHKSDNAYERIMIGKGTTWVSWDETTGDGDPFPYLEVVRNYEKLRSLLLYHNLGLIQEYRTYPQVVFKYNLPPRIDIHYPTFIDAGSYEYFAVSGPTDKHGYTSIYMEDVQKIDHIDSYSQHIRPRPEGVHGDLRLFETEAEISPCS